MNKQLDFFNNETLKSEQPEAVGFEQLVIPPVIEIDFGNGTLSSIKLAVSSVIFTWMLKGDKRIWRMASIKKHWTPKEVLQFMKDEDREYLKWINYDDINEMAV